jgi:hypothetical protein
MKRMLTKNVGMAAALAALAIGGVSLSTTANASSNPRFGHGHGHGDGAVGQHNTTISPNSPTTNRGFQHASPTSSGGQNSIQNAFCRKSTPCRISQKVNFLPWDVSAFISFGPKDYLVVP